MAEINQSLSQLQKSYSSRINFIPVRGNFSRGIFATTYIDCKIDLVEIRRIYEEYYDDHSFTFITDKNPDLKQVVNTNKCLIHLQKIDDKLLSSLRIDNLLKGASGPSGPQHELIVRVGGDGWLTLKTLSVLKNTTKMNLFDVYPLFNIEIVQGKGCHVWDSEGNEYLDLYGGHAVISVGHSHPTYVKAITEQVNKLGFYSNSVISCATKISG